MAKKLVPAEYQKAHRHLSRRDPVLRRVIRTVGPCTLRVNGNHFGLLVASIISQQISGKAAESISARLHAALAPAGISVDGIRKAKEDLIRGAGLSKAKTRAVRDLAAKVHAREVELHTLHQHDDEEVIAQLLPVFGIGRWTAEMFLIFSLGRLDVLPVADLGLRAGVQRHYELKELPDKAQLQELAEPWRPYRSIATWYVWRSLGGVPQSD